MKSAVIVAFASVLLGLGAFCMDFQESSGRAEDSYNREIDSFSADEQQKDEGSLSEEKGEEKLPWWHLPQSSRVPERFSAPR